MTRTTYLAIASALAAGAIFAAPAFTQQRPAAPSVRIQAGDGGTLGLAHTIRIEGAAAPSLDGGVASIYVAAGAGGVLSVGATAPVASSGGQTPTISLTACADGQVLKSDGGAWGCATDNNTTYVAGNQLALDGGTFHVVEGAGSGLSADLIDGFEPGDLSVSHAQTATSAATLSQQLTLDKLPACSLDDEVLRYDLIAGWFCSTAPYTDTNTTYSAGDGLSLGGAAFGLDFADCNPTVGAKSRPQYVAGTGWTCADDTDTFATLGATCATNYIPKKQTGGWECWPDNDTLAGLTCDVGDGARYVDLGGGNGWDCIPSYSVSPARWDDIRVSAESAKPGATRVPGFEQVVNNGGTSTGVYAYHFDATSDEDLFFSVQLPHGYAEGTDLKPHLHWLQKTTGTGNVVWGVECTKAAVGSTFGFTAFKTVIAAAESQYEHALAAFTDLTGTGLTISSMLLCRVYRDADNAADTFAADAVLLEIDFHYQVNSVGSASDTSK